MTTTVRDLRAWLDRFDDDVEVTIRVDSGVSLPFDPSNHAYYFDSTRNPYLKESDPYYMRKIIEIGV